VSTPSPKKIPELDARTTLLSTDVFAVSPASGDTEKVTFSTLQTELGITGFLEASNNLDDLDSASTARTNLGLGTVATQAASAVAITGGSFEGEIGAASTFETASDTRTALGLGTIATQAASSVAITGGSIEGEIGAASTFETASDTRTALGLGTIATAAATDYVDVTNGQSVGGVKAFTDIATVVDANGGTAYSLGYRDIPQNEQDTTYQFVLSDRGKSVGKDSTSARTYTVPPNATVAFPPGAAITVYNMGSAGNITIAEGSGVDIYLAGSGTPGNRTLGVRGVCTLLKTDTNTWLASGAELS
jgi:hypothetical protein